MQLMEIWTIAYALLLAHDQWGSDGEINYLIEANRIIINGLKTSNTKNYRMMLGDWWIYGDWEWAPGEGNNSHIGDSMELKKIPSTIFLLPNFPNPFNPITIISYGLSEDTHVTLRIYNTLGQEVITLVDEYQQAGYKTVVWTGSDKLGFKINSGIYFYQLKAGNFRDIKTMICLH